MRITITFPDGKREPFEIDVTRFRSVAEITEYIASEMADRWIRRTRGKRKKRAIMSREKYIEGIIRWLYPQVVSALIEELSRMGMLPGE